MEDLEELIKEVERKTAKGRYWFPAFVVILGLMVVVMLFVANRINIRQQQDAIFMDSIEDFQVQASLYNFWFEKQAAGDESAGDDKATSHADKAEHYIQTMLKGGMTDHGVLLNPAIDTQIITLLGSMSYKLKAFRKGRSQRLALELGEQGLAQETGLDVDKIFISILRDADDLEKLFFIKQAEYISSAMLLMKILVGLWATALIFTIVWLVVLERRRARERELILESEDRYRNLFQQASDYVLVLSATHGSIPTVVDANVAAFEKHNYSRSELLGKSVSQIETTESVSRYQGIVSRLRQDGAPVHYEVERIRKDGTRFKAEASARMVWSGGKELIYAIERDITERKKTEAELSQSEKRFRNFFEESPFAMREEDFSGVKRYIDTLMLRGVDELKTHFKRYPDDWRKCAELIRVMDVNRMTLDLYKAADKEELEEGFRKNATREYSQAIIEDLVSISSGKKIKGRETITNTLSGAQLNSIIKVAIAPGYEDTWGRVLVSIIDVTETRRGESLNKELGRILEDSLNEIFIYDATSLKFVEVNQEARKNLGFSIDELSKMTPLDLKPEYTLYLFEDLIEPLRSGEKDRVHFETIHKRSDGSTYPVEVHLQHSTLNSKPVFVAIVLDITERKVAEEELKLETETTRNLLKITEATLHTTDIERLMDNVVSRTHETIGNDITLTYLWDRDTRCFRPSKGAGLDDKLSPFFMTETISSEAPFLKDLFKMPGVVVKSLTYEKIRNNIDESGLFKWLGGISDMALIPLIGRKRKLGLIACIDLSRSKDGGSFTEKRRELLQAVANNVSTALEETLLYKDSVDTAMELSRKVETIQTMSEMGKSILSTHESKIILETTVMMISKLVPCDLVRVVLVDRAKREFNFIAGTKEGSTLNDNLVSFDDSCLTEVVDTSRVQYIPALDKVSAPRRIENELFNDGHLSALRIPVVIKGDIFAVLGVMARRRSAFTPGDRDILEKLASHIGIALENARLITDLEDLFINTIKTLADTIEAKSRWTRGHSDRVTVIAEKIGRAMSMGTDELKKLELAGQLHDIGKIGTYESILDKPGKLTTEELEVIRKHPDIGASLLSPIKQLNMVIPGVMLHHECFDGSGYPNGLKGDEIPLIAKILSVADTVDAMSADRPYRKGMSMSMITSELIKYSGTQFDPEVVNAFLKAQGTVGSKSLH